MKIWANHWSRQHLVILGVMLALFSVLTFLITSRGLSAGEGRITRVIQATAATIAGPITGAISRGMQSFCVAFSLQVMRYCLPVLMLCALVQFIRLPGGAFAEVLRLSVWAMGLFVWFGGGVYSFLHALG